MPLARKFVASTSEQMTPMSPISIMAVASASRPRSRSNAASNRLMLRHSQKKSKYSLCSHSVVPSALSSMLCYFERLLAAEALEPAFVVPQELLDPRMQRHIDGRFARVGEELAKAAVVALRPWHLLLARHDGLANVDNQLFVERFAAVE